MGLFSFLGGALKPLGKIIDSVHTSSEEKLQLKLALTTVQNELSTAALDYEQELNKAKASIIVAEAQSQSWITRSWRPITMLTFVVLIVLISTGLMDVDALRAVPDRLWTLMQIGIGGYIGGRTAEKIIPGAIAAMKKRDEV